MNDSCADSRLVRCPRDLPPSAVPMFRQKSWLMTLYPIQYRSEVGTSGSTFPRKSDSSELEVGRSARGRPAPRIELYPANGRRLNPSFTAWVRPPSVAEAVDWPKPARVAR